MPNKQKSRVGLLTDIHYDGSAPAMNRLYEAMSVLNHGGVEALIVMGDLVNANSESNARRLLREVAALCEVFKGPIHYMHGNHDLDHLSKAEFYSAIGQSGKPSRFHLGLCGYTVICIDGNFSPDESAYDHGNFQWEESFIPEEELDWLRSQLAASLLPVVVISHQRIDCSSIHSVNNDAAVREIISLSGKVKAVFQGHRHEDDLKQIDGTSYYTLGAHVDEAGPAVVTLDHKGVRLARDFSPMEEAAP